jgi:rod shape-determining protein MreD
MISLLLILFGFSLLVLQTALGTLLPMHGFAPNLMLPIAVYLGVSAEVHLVRGALISFLLGYLLDSFCGNPMGLQTFVLTASFVVARGAGLRLFPQGGLFQVLLSFLIAIAFGATVLALRAIFEQPSVTMLGSGVGESGATLLRSAAATALVSPLVFAVTGRLESLGLQKQREHRTVSSR